MAHSLPSPSRIQVIGTSCSGKSTFSKELSRSLGIPYIELDALHWGPNWQEPEDHVFRSRVSEAVSADSWIVDGSYGRKIGDTVSGRRNCIIWIDLGLPRILFRFFKRSIGRSIKKEILWGGCQETLKNSIFQKDSLLLWILKHHGPSRVKYLTYVENPPEGVRVIRLKSTREIQEFLNMSFNSK